MFEEDIRTIILKEQPSNLHDYILDAVKPFAVSQLTSSIKNCKDCSLTKSSKKYLPVIHEESCILVINDIIETSQNAKCTEDTVEYRLFMKAMKAYHVDVSKICWFNMPCCSGGLKKCISYLGYTKKIIDPILTIALGGASIRLYSDAIPVMRYGEFMDICGDMVIATYSPNYIIKYENLDDPDGLEEIKAEFSEHLLKAILWCQEEYPDFRITSQRISADDYKIN